MGRGKKSRAVVAIVALWLLHDFVVPPRYAIDARATLAAIDLYRANVSPHIGRFVAERDDLADDPANGDDLVADCERRHEHALPPNPLLLRPDEQQIHDAEEDDRDEE